MAHRVADPARRGLVVRQRRRLGPVLRGRLRRDAGVAANLVGATPALLAGPLLVHTGFWLLSLLSVVVLAPLAVLTASSRLGGWAGAGADG